MSASSPPRRLNPRVTKAGLLVPVRLTPKARNDEIAGAEIFNGDMVLKARVRALPADGQANEALIKLVATWLGVPRSCVSVAQGGKSRLKQVLIEGDAEQLGAQLASRCADFR